MNDAPSFAADGKTPVYNRAGVGLVVSATAFNAVCGQRDLLEEILKDLCDLNAEGWANGGGPGYRERFAKAWKRAHEQFEP